MSQPFDFDKALKALQSGQALTGKDGILTPLMGVLEILCHSSKILTKRNDTCPNPSISTKP